MNRKILFIVFTILLVATLGEAIYLTFHFSKLQKLNQASKNKELNSKIETATSRPQTRRPNAKIAKEVDAFYRFLNPNIAIDPKVIHSLIFLNKDVLQSSVIKNIFQGEIIEIDRNKGTPYFDYYSYDLKIIIASKNDKTLKTTFYLSADDLSKTEFLELKNGKEISITIEDLAIGDIIKIEDTVDAMKINILPTPVSGYDYLTESWGYNRIKLMIIKLLSQ